MTLDDVMAAAAWFAGSLDDIEASHRKDALRASILSYGRAQRERCAVECEAWFTSGFMAAAIRALPDEVAMNIERDAA